MGLAPPPSARAPLGAHGLPQEPARAGDAAGRRPSRERAAPHARPASRGGRPARRRRAVLVHVARAGPRHQAVRAGARRAGPGPARSTPPSAPTSSTSPASSCRCPPATTRARRRPTSPTSSSAWRRTRPTCIGPRTDVLAWNAAATAMLGEPTRAPDGRQNLLWWLFTTDEPRTRAAPGAPPAARSRASAPSRRAASATPTSPRSIDALDAGQRAVPRLVAAPRGADRAARHEDHRAPARRAASCCTTCSRLRRATPTCG